MFSWWNSIKDLDAIYWKVIYASACVGIATALGTVFSITLKYRVTKLEVIEKQKEREKRDNADKESAEILKQTHIRLKTTEEALSASTNDLRSLKLKYEGVQLSSQQKERFSNSLMGVPRGKFCVFFTVQEPSTTSFAIQVNDLMSSNGFISTQPPSLMMGFGGLPFQGVALQVHSKDKQPIFASAVQNAFKAMDIDAPGSFGAPDDGLLWILVGVHPGQKDLK